MERRRDGQIDRRNKGASERRTDGKTDRRKDGHKQPFDVVAVWWTRTCFIRALFSKRTLIRRLVFSMLILRCNGRKCHLPPKLVGAAEGTIIYVTSRGDHKTIKVARAIVLAEGGEGNMHQVL